jgi:hypothetical protein
MILTRHHTSVRALLMIAVLSVLISAGILSGGAARASASSSQVSIIQDPARTMYEPATTLSTFRALGARVVRVVVVWAQIAPNPTSSTPLSGFNASDPSDYPASNWAPYDQIVQLAQQDGLALDFTLSGGAPRWAEGPGIPKAALNNPFWAWRPSAQDFGQFVRAVATRYSGQYVPDGQTSPLPRVNFWALWNEPNFGEDLGPQAVNGSAVAVAPGLYRGLAGQAWNALQTTGHGHDTVLIGEFAPRGQSARGTRSQPQGLPGQFGQSKPLQFLRTLYCVDSSYRQLRGSAAQAVGCPTTAAGSRAFRRQNPVLFKATGLADHPYPYNLPPTTESSRDPDIAPFPRLPNLERALDRVQRMYGSSRHLPIYNTEYGYITNPPNHQNFVSPTTAGYYINWAEYLSWKQPQIASTMQYLLYDPLSNPFAPMSGFASGLLFASGTAKPTYADYRLPLYLPVTSSKRGRSLEVWGCVRPARYTIQDAGPPQTAQIQFAPGSSGSFTTLRTVTISNPDNCYFDLRMTFPGSGTIRLSYTYPSDPLVLDPAGLSGSTVYSRSVAIKLR